MSEQQVLAVEGKLTAAERQVPVVVGKLAAAVGEEGKRQQRAQSPKKEQQLQEHRRVLQAPMKEWQKHRILIRKGWR